MNRSTAADEIAAHIAQHGVTRCPAAFVAPTNVEAHRARQPYAPCRFGGARVSRVAFEGRGR